MDHVYFTLTALLQPYTLSLLLTAVGLVYLWWRSPGLRRRLLLVVLPFVALVLFSLPALSYFALGSLEWYYPPLPDRPPETEAIVVLAGGIRPPDSIRAEPELRPDTYYRCVHAADLYRRGGPCPVVVSGGKVEEDRSGPPCAEVMHTVLVQLGVSAADILLENESHTTYENAVRCRQLLEERHLHRIVLVTEATHMFRAERCFRKQGLEVTPSACNYLATDFDWEVVTFVPRAGAAERMHEVLHEWLGTLWYWCQGRI
jgi:uncharacterized SAM-binding protein YcdF (DUF218 family)